MVKKNISAGLPMFRNFTLGCLLLLLAACSGVGQQPPREAVVEKKADSAAALGIKLLGIRYSAAGYMMDFRYTVLEPDKSGPMFNRAAIPFLLHEKSGAKFMVPNPAKVGPLRATTRKPEAGKRYYIMFANPGKYVQQGDLVTVVVGDHRFEHLKLQ